MRFTKSIGFLVLGIYLIIVGLMSFVPGLAIPPIVLGILAFVAGILIILDR